METFKGQVEAAVEARDLELFSTFLAEDCVFRDVTEHEPRVGREKFVEFVKGLLADMTDTKNEYLNVFSDGEFVAGEVALHALYRGVGAAPGGTRVVMHYCIVDQIRDGLVQRETVYWNPDELNQQLPAAT
ncbi:nuclear transport factor 2 family protein [Mycobacterium aquaticum]|uniref:nuclear transport factor 2 family protein n=1 Tax=Mycobacterium aquaticum TaxID=1927124 RepID=UPI00130205C3|nr:nuclear transport factor 2 family protein [Mycobacterium aquaticum]